MSPFIELRRWKEVIFVKYTPHQFKQFVESRGLENIKVKELNKIIDTHGLEVFDFYNFNEIYNLVSSRESNYTMNKLTWWIAGMTLVSTICALISAFK